MTETTLERMARAAYESSGDAGIRTPPWDKLRADHPLRLRKMVEIHAALKAARTPDHEITAAVIKPGADRAQAVLDFRAMIDAILGEKP